MTNLSPAYRMFTGELGGALSLSYIMHTAREVRALVAREMFDGDWEKAKRAGWRVVRVVIQKEGD